MNSSPDPKDAQQKDTDKSNVDKPSVNGDPDQGKSDPQLTELDGLKKGGVAPNVNPVDKEQGPNALGD